jgi:hypothetical protein
MKREEGIPLAGTLAWRHELPGTLIHSSRDVSIP